MAEIHSARLRLRPVCLADAEAISAFTSDIKVARMTTRIPHPNSVEAVQASLASLEGGPEHVFAANGGGKLMGVCSYRDSTDPALGEIGYWIGKPYWGQGYATEMTRALIRYIFQATGRSAIPISHFIDNSASARVIAKCGFTPTGRRTLPCVSRGHDVVALTYMLTRESAQAQPWYAGP